MLSFLCQNSDSQLYKISVMERMTDLGSSSISTREQHSSVNLFFCTNHSRIVSHQRTSTGYQNEYILLLQFPAPGKNTKQKNIQHKIFNQGVMPRKQ